MPEALRVPPNSNCRHFDRVFWSLIEEPDVCELCSHYEDNGSLCTCEAQIQESK